MSKPYTLEFTMDDFEILTRCFRINGSMRSFFNHPDQSGRFETISEGPTPTVDAGYVMHWTGESALTALVAEKLLRAAGYEVHRLWDMAENPSCQWCLLTNYMGPHSSEVAQ